MLASINGTDITGYIQETSYQVNQAPIYEEWTDGNYKTHREETRQKITGNFDLIFVRATDLDNFLKLVDENSTGSLLTITLWIQNKNRAVETQVYFSFEAKTVVKISDNYTFHEFTVTIEEA